MGGNGNAETRGVFFSLKNAVPATGGNPSAPLVTINA